MELLLVESLLFAGITLSSIHFTKHKSRKATTGNALNVYVIRTHIWNAYVENVFNKMQQQLGRENVFLLFDETHGPIQQPYIQWNDPAGLYEGPGIITINEEDCKQINRLHSIGEKTGSINRAEAQVYACYYAIKRDYDYLWFMEFDVYCNDYKQALSQFDNIKADMLTTYIKPANKHRKWPWWPFLTGEISKVPVAQRTGCFFPVNRFSKPFLSILEKNLSKSSGYCEVYFPTLCQSSGLIVKQLPASSLGIFRFRPVISGKEFKKIKATDNRLYHPVKEME